MGYVWATRKNIYKILVYYVTQYTNLYLGVLIGNIYSEGNEENLGINDGEVIRDSCKYKFNVMFLLENHLSVIII